MTWFLNVITWKDWEFPDTAEEWESRDATCIKAAEGAWSPETDGGGAKIKQEVFTITHPCLYESKVAPYKPSGFSLDHFPHLIF